MSWSLRLCLPLDATLENALLIDIASAVICIASSPLFLAFVPVFPLPKTTILARVPHIAPASLAGFSEVRKLQFKCISGSSRVLCVFFALVTGYPLAAYPSAPAWSSLDWFVSTATLGGCRWHPATLTTFHLRGFSRRLFPPGHMHSAGTASYGMTAAASSATVSVSGWYTRTHNSINLGKEHKTQILGCTFDIFS